jgi:hypothetical protein
MQTEPDEALLPCPFCGGAPTLPVGRGTQYEIECQECGMACCSVQICDLMTLEERRDGWNDATLSYAPQYVERARIEAIAAWNTRAGQSASAAEIAARDAEIARLREALTPSEETKRAYWGEFEISVDDYDETGREVARRVSVPWFVIKEIMRAIALRAALNEGDA